MRGKGKDHKQDRRHPGITPAYAGKSEKARNCVIFPGDHPRLCGEKENGDTVLDVTVGSPPPMRGKAEYSYDITSFYKDHPRLCGEKAVLRTTFSHTHRITPAYAGKSSVKPDALYAT